MNSDSNLIINRSTNEIYRENQKYNCINKDVKNDNNMTQRNKPNFTKYLTLNLAQNAKDKEKNDCKEIFKKRQTKKNSRNIFNTTNDINEKRSKLSFIKPQSWFIGNLNNKGNDYLTVISNNQNKNYKKLKNIKIRKYFAENNYNFSNNKIIIPIYQNIFDDSKLNKGKYRKYYTNDNSIDETNKSIQNKNRKSLEEHIIKKNMSKINKQIGKSKSILTKKINKKLCQKSDIHLRYKTEKFEQKIIEKNDLNKKENYQPKKFFYNNFFQQIYANKRNDINNINKSMSKLKQKQNSIYNIKEIFKLKDDIKEKFITFSPSVSFIPYKGIDILNKLIKKRRHKIWKTLKYKIEKIKNYNNIFNIQSISYNNIQIKNNFLKEQLNEKNNKKHKYLKNANNSEKNIYIPKTEDNFGLHKEKKINHKALQNKINDNSNNENQKRIVNLKNIYIKYFIFKKNQINNTRLRMAFYKINKNNIIINNNENRRKFLLKNIIKLNEKINKFLLRITFIKFYYKSKLLRKQRKSYCFKNFQDDFYLMQLLYHIFYQKEKNNALLLKKYFEKFIINTKLKNSNIIENNQINYIKRNRKLKLIITKIINHNNIIIKSILKQWLLRSKIIKILKPELRNIKKEKKNIQKEDLINGINKLNSIFKLNKIENIKVNDDNNQNNNIINENKEVKVNNRESIKETFEKENRLQKLYRDKYCTDCILEEKDEEQNEDNL